MNVVNRFESSIVQFPENPFARNWPEPAAVDALFRYCVRRTMDVCLSNPRLWLTSDDLRSLLAQVLREELPSHGLPAYAVHLGYPFASDAKSDSKSPRHRQVLDLVLVLPETIQWEASNRQNAAIALAAAVKLGFDIQGADRELISRLAALRGKMPDILCYLVVMGFQDTQEAIDTLTRAAQEAGLTLLCDNYTGLADDIRQEKLL